MGKLGLTASEVAKFIVGAYKGDNEDYTQFPLNGKMIQDRLKCNNLGVYYWEGEVDVGGKIHKVNLTGQPDRVDDDLVVEVKFGVSPEYRLYQEELAIIQSLVYTHLHQNGKQGKKIPLSQGREFCYVVYGPESTDPADWEFNRKFIPYDSGVVYPIGEAEYFELITEASRCKLNSCLLERPKPKAEDKFHRFLLHKYIEGHMGRGFREMEY
jgi:hypothetical protein